MKTVRSPDRVAPGNPHSRTGREIPGCGGWASNPAPARVARKRRQPPAALAPQAPAPAAPTGLPERRRTDAETYALLRPACVPTSSRAGTSSRMGAGSRTLQVPAAWGRGERVVDFPPFKGIGEGNGDPLQYSCLENPMDRGAWWATIHGVAKSRTRLTTSVCVKDIKSVHRPKMRQSSLFSSLLYSAPSHSAKEFCLFFF